MKRSISLLLLVASIVLTMPVMAADTSKDTGFYDIEAKENVIIKPFMGDTEVTVTEENLDRDEELEKWYVNSDSLEVTYTDAVDGGYYGILLVEGDDVPTIDNAIFYIDQVEAEGTTIDFNVYPILPKKATKLSLYISSNVEDFELIKISLNYYAPAPTYVLGDINNDGKFNVEDALIVLKIGVGDYPGVTSDIKAAADVNLDGSWDVRDALMILKRSVGDIDSFE